jgi:hypothetical protein
VNTAIERAEYCREENWFGSFYEFSLELGPAGDDAVARRALEALWQQPELRGPWRERTAFASPPDPSLLPPENVSQFGSLTLGKNIEVGCASYLVRIEGESDWLDLSVPTGMLELRFPVRYPLDRTTNPWLADLDRVLGRIAAKVYEVAPFRLGLLGEEASGATSAGELTGADCERGGFLVPEHLWRKLAPKRAAELLAPGVVYAPFIGPHVTYGR